MEEHWDWILALIAKQPDLTLEEILAVMAKQGIPGSRSALQRFFDRHNVSFKKKPARGRAERGRPLFAADVGYESKACLTLLGWCLSTRPLPAQTWCGSEYHAGSGCMASVPHGHWKTITFVAGLRHDGIVAPFLIDGAMNGPIFLAYVGLCLAPTLGRRDIVIMDNLPAHKVAGVIEAIEALAHQSALPSYSTRPRSD